MKGIYGILLKTLSFFIKILGIVMVLSVVLQITGRYVPMISFMWTEELARLTFIWFCFLGIAITYHYKGHMSINYFCAKLNTNLQRFFGYLCNILILVFSSIITYYGIRLSIMARVQTSPMLQLSFSWFYAAVPAGFMLIAIFSNLEIIGLSFSSDANQ